jgi:hypothetical protein
MSVSYWFLSHYFITAEIKVSLHDIQIVHQLGIAESIECFIDDQAFSPSYDLAPTPPLPPFSRQLARPVTT